MRSGIAAIAIIASAGIANAQTTVSVNAMQDGSAEIRNDGPRLFQGDISTRFWNVQEPGNFATISVMQFNADDIAAAVAPGADRVGAVRFSIFQDPAGFTTTDVNVRFYHAGADLPLTLAGLDGVNFGNVLTQFDASPIADDFVFVRQSGGFNDIINLFGQGLAGQAGFEANLLAGGTVTILAATDAGVASWAGAGDTPFDRPSLTVELVPAPGAAALLGLGGLFAARRRR